MHKMLEKFSEIHNFADDLTMNMQRQSLRNCTVNALEHYFAELGDSLPTNLYELVLAEVEAPLLEVVLQQTKGNQSKAAALLGLSRSTLRKKLKQYHLE